MTDLVERPRFHDEGQTTPVGPRWYIWDGVEGHFARFQNIADAGDAQAICEMLNEQSDTITRLQAALTKCADKFEEYAELHHAKLADTSSPRAIEAIMEKVMRNREMADMCRSSVGGE